MKKTVKKIGRILYIFTLIIGCGFMSVFFLTIFLMGIASTNAGY